MYSISKILGQNTQRSEFDAQDLFLAQLKKAFEQKQGANKNNDAMKAFETAMQKMQGEQPQESQNAQKPKKPKSDEGKYRAIAEKMADQKGNSNGKVDTPQEEADVKGRHCHK